MLDLNEIAMFVQVVGAGSFAKAARRLQVPANTLSRRIRQLEDHLGVRLLHRSTRKLTLTDAGRSLHDQSASQVRDLLTAARQFSNDSAEPVGTVRIAAPVDFFEFYPMDWIAGFFRDNANVQLSFILSEEISDLIGEGIDLAFRGGKMPDSSLVARKIRSGRMILAASPSYLQECGTPSSLQGLAEHQCIPSSKQAGPATWHMDGPDGPDQVQVSGRFSANTPLVRLKAAIAGFGICLLPDTLLLQSFRSGLLVEVLPQYGFTSSDFYVVYPSRRQIPRAVTAFVDSALQRLDSESAF